PVALKGGSSAPVVLRITRNNFAGEIHLTFDAPPHIHLNDALAKPGEDQVELVAQAGRFAATGEAGVAIGATAGHFHLESQLPLRVAPPDPPTGCGRSYQAVRGEDIQYGANRKKYYGRLTLILADGTPIPFVFVPGSSSGSAVPFYIMENKVSNGLFRRFASANPSFALDIHWRRGGRIFYMLRNSAGQSELVEMDLGAPDSAPVLRCSPEDAGRFAQWLSGILPADYEWDAAAGRGEKKLAGPFQADPKKLLPWLALQSRGWFQPSFGAAITPAPQWDW